jgi:hypothetical protein
MPKKIEWEVYAQEITPEHEHVPPGEGWEPFAASGEYSNGMLWSTVWWRRPVEEED